jgi:hypothetical protein
MRSEDTGEESFFGWDRGINVGCLGDGKEEGTCRTRSGDEGDIGCDCDRGMMHAAALLPASLGEWVLVLLHSSSAGTPVKKKPVGGAEVLARGVGCINVRTHM